MERRASARSRSRSDTHAAMRAKQIEYVRELMRRTNMPPSRIAKEVGRSTTTLTRFLAEDYDGTLHPSVVQALAEWSGIPFTDAAPTQTSKQPAPREEAMPYEVSDADDDRVISAAIADRDVMVWEMKISLPGALLKKGDLVVVDQNEEPEFGDLVCCQYRTGLVVTTAFKIWQSPFLVGVEGDLSTLNIEFVDTRNPPIIGTVTDVIRKRRPQE